MHPARYLRTTNFRLTALYAALFGVSSLIVFGVVYWMVADAFDKQKTLLVEAELSVLEQEFRVGREFELTREINQRLASGKHPYSYYLLQDVDGQKLAGNLPAMTPFDGWRRVPAPYPAVAEIGGDPTEQTAHTGLIRGKFLADGIFVVAGISSYQSDESKEAIRSAFFWAVGVVLALAVGGGLILSGSFLHRIEEINRTANAINNGDLSERIRTSGTNDEMDRLASNLNAMLDQIQMLMESLQQVSSNIAHDLRKPLGRLRQNLEATRQSRMSIEDYETVINTAISDADGILATFSSLLRIAQIEAGMRRSSFRPIDLSQIFQNVAEAYVPVAEDAGKKINVDIAPGLMIDGDRELLAQLLANLADNALTHTPPGTAIRIGLIHSRMGPVGTVSDNGPGIPAQERDQIFGRFYRLETSRTTPGNGLGLALVKAVADLHGASISVIDNCPGIIFEIRFKTSD